METGNTNHYKLTINGEEYINVKELKNLTNPNDRAYSDTGNSVRYAFGLTKREYFAGQALGLFRNTLDPQLAAKTAIELADALIEELNKGKV